MKTKLIFAGFLALTGIASAQWSGGCPETLIGCDAGIGVAAPAHPLHVVLNNAAHPALIAGQFEYVATNSGFGHAALKAVATDRGCASGTPPLATHLAGVVGEAYNGLNTYGGAFSAGNNCPASIGAVVTIGVYGKLDPFTGPNSAGICAGVYADDWSTGGTLGAGPNWSLFGVGDVGTTTGYYIISDRKLKTNIKPMTKALDKIMLLKPSTYTYKSDDYKGLSLSKKTQIGLIAQELEEVFPDLVKETGLPGRDENGKIFATGETIKTVNYTNLVPVLIAAMQEQQQQINEQKALINELLEKAGDATRINEINGATGFSMSQNEPNPFNGETVVKYTLPQQVKAAHMAVYDLSGKQIATFPITEKGSSSMTITSQNLAAGIYIYSIIADNKIVDTKRMVVAEK